MEGIGFSYVRLEKGRGRGGGKKEVFHF